MVICWKLVERLVEITGSRQQWKDWLRSRGADKLSLAEVADTICWKDWLRWRGTDKLSLTEVAATGFCHMFGYQTNEECAKLWTGEKELGRDLIWIQGDLSDHNLCELKPIPVYATSWLFEGTGFNLNLSYVVRSGNTSANLGHMSHEPPSLLSDGLLLSLRSVTRSQHVGPLGTHEPPPLKTAAVSSYLLSVLCFLVTLLFVITDKARTVGNRDRDMHRFRKGILKHWTNWFYNCRNEIVRWIVPNCMND